MSATAKLLVTGRDMDSRTLHLQSEGYIWQLLEEESSSQQAEKEIPEYLHQVRAFLQGVGTWQGTATQLLEAAGVTGVLPNQLTRKLVEHYYTVLAPCGIQYQTRWTAGARLLSFSCDGHDDDDGKKEIPSDAGGMAEISSLPSSSSQALLHSEHGLCVATGHLFAGADDTAHTGSAPNPLASEEKAV